MFGTSSPALLSGFMTASEMAKGRLLMVLREPISRDLSWFSETHHSNSLIFAMSLLFPVLTSAAPLHEPPSQIIAARASCWNHQCTREWALCPSFLDFVSFVHYRAPAAVGLLCEHVCIAPARRADLYTRRFVFRRGGRYLQGVLQLQWNPYQPHCWALTLRTSPFGRQPSLVSKSRCYNTRRCSPAHKRTCKALPLCSAFPR